MIYLRGRVIRVEAYLPLEHDDDDDDYKSGMRSGCDIKKYY